MGLERLISDSHSKSHVSRVQTMRSRSRSSSRPRDLSLNNNHVREFPNRDGRAISFNASNLIQSTQIFLNYFLNYLK